MLPVPVPVGRQGRAGVRSWWWVVGGRLGQPRVGCDLLQAHYHYNDHNASPVKRNCLQSTTEDTVFQHRLVLSLLSLARWLLMLARSAQCLGRCC